MVELNVIPNCNHCGECCRHGGACILRAKSWSLQDIPLEFDGVCELLMPEGECSVMKNVIAQDGSDAALRRYVGVVGLCNFPLLRKEVL